MARMQPPLPPPPPPPPAQTPMSEMLLSCRIGTQAAHARERSERTSARACTRTLTTMRGLSRRLARRQRHDYDGALELSRPRQPQGSGPATAPTAAGAADAPVGTPAPGRSRPGPRGTQQPELVASGGQPAGLAGGLGSEGSRLWHPPALAGRRGLIRGPGAESESALALAQHWATVARPVKH